MIRTTEILTPATVSDLTTLATLKDQIDVTDTTADVYLARQIRTASSWIVEQCSRTFGHETVRDMFRNAGPYGDTWQCRPLMDIRPLLLSRNLLEPGAVSVVTITGEVMDPSLYSVDEKAGLIWRLSSSGTGTNWAGPVTVTYVSGWALPVETNPTLPAVIEDVCLDRAGQAYYARGRDPNILRERVDSGASDVAYTQTAPDAPPDARLAAFRIDT